MPRRSCNRDLRVGRAIAASLLGTDVVDLALSSLSLAMHLKSRVLHQPGAWKIDEIL